ncbi:MAG: Flp pilus assembly complex ATPase component TadA [Alphaproteobacteria bacterium]|nr:Flp pilus assembly complex ATPase component TadA [Alphaproteobacteria bacterium]
MDKQTPEQQSAKETTSAPVKPMVMSSAALLKREASNKGADTGPQMINDAKFTKLYITPEKVCYTKSGISASGLKIAKYIDLPDFARTIVEAFNKQDLSYSVDYKGRNYQVEVIQTITGLQFCISRMPVSIPDVEKLGYTLSVSKMLQSLGDKSGLILVAGSSGSGKTTTMASLLKKYLQLEGGYALTVEDPVELPLDGVYKTVKGDLGICKQTTPENKDKLKGLKHVLRSKPRYIYLNEIDSSEVAEEVLKISTSGHLVIASIKANGINDALKILARYITTSSVGEDMGYNLLANGLLACIYQELVGTPKHIRAECLFANPDLSAGCQVRGMLRSGNINATTQMEQQKGKMERGQPLF